MLLKTNRDIIKELLAMAVLFCAVFSNISEAVGYYLSRLSCVLGALLLLLCLIYNRISIRSKVAILFGCFLAIINVIFVGTLSFSVIIVILSVYVPLALFFVLEDSYSVRAWYCFILVMGITILSIMLTNPNPYKLFYNSSRNYVSIYLTLFVFFLSVINVKAGKSMPVWMIVFYFVVCILAVGRGGILASGVYVIGTCIIRSGFSLKLNTKAAKKVLFALLLLLILLILIRTNYEYIANKFFSRFVDVNKAGSDSERLILLRTYLSAISPQHSLKNFIFGVNTYYLSPLLASFGGNIHNSFFMVHAGFGIIGVLVIFISIAWVIISNIRLKRYELALIVFVMGIRSLTDYVFPGIIGDIYCWYCILSLCNRSNKAARTYECL